MQTFIWKHAGNRSPEVEYLLFLPHPFAFTVSPVWSKLTAVHEQPGAGVGARHICPRLGGCGGCSWSPTWGSSLRHLNRGRSRWDRERLAGSPRGAAWEWWEKCSALSGTRLGWALTRARCVGARFDPAGCWAGSRSWALPGDGEPEAQGLAGPARAARGDARGAPRPAEG